MRRRWRLRAPSTFEKSEIWRHRGRLSEDRQTEAESRYIAACERLELVRAAWIEAGSPFVQRGGRGLEVEHALHKVLRLQEMLVDRLSIHARPGKVGRPPSAVPGLPAPLKAVS